MPTVNQMLQAWAKTHGNPPFWVVVRTTLTSTSLQGIMTLVVLADRMETVVGNGRGI